jgi:hypothetical protein
VKKHILEAVDNDPSVLIHTLLKTHSMDLGSRGHLQISGYATVFRFEGRADQQRVFQDIARSGDLLGTPSFIEGARRLFD